MKYVTYRKFKKRNIVLIYLFCLIFFLNSINIITFARSTDEQSNQTRHMNLGNVSQDIDLQALSGKYPKGSIEIDSNGNPIAIYWTYKKKVTKISLEDSNRNQSELSGFAEDYFTTVAGSGLGVPELISVKNLDTNQNVFVDKSNTSADDLNVRVMSSLKTKIEVANLSEGTYEYVVKTPIKEHRRYYVLDVNARLSANFSKGQRVNINGDYQTMYEDKKMTSDGSIRGVVDSRRYSEFKYDDDYLHPNDMIDEKGTYHVGNYLNTQDILWYASTVNKYQEEDSESLNTTIDASQETVESDQVVYVFSPSDNGYQKVKRRTEGGNIVTETLKPSDILLVRRKAWMNRNNNEKEMVNHFFGDGTQKASIEPFKLRPHIVREWTADVTDDKKTDSKFRISTPTRANETSEVMISKTQSEAYDTRTVRDRFEEETGTNYIPSRGKWKLLKWEVEQIDLSHGMYVTTKMLDYKRMEYFFRDGILKEYEKPQTSDGQVCERYGVIAIGSDSGKQNSSGVHEVDPIIKMNQYEYYRDPNDTNNTDHGQFFQGGSLYGRFRIPANAQAGDRFTMELPQEIIFNGHVYNDKGYIGDIYATLGGEKKNIGRMYISHSTTTILDNGGYWDKRYSTITFKLNANANWPESYEGNFFMGDELRGWDKYGNQNPTYRIKTINNIPIDESQLRDFIIKQGFVVGPDLVDLSYPYKAQTLDKQVDVKTEYFDSGGRIDDECQKKLDPVRTNIKGYFVNPYINQQNGLMRKFVLEEGVDDATGKPYITYRLIFNGGMLGSSLEVSPNMYFFDYMPEGVELLYGNNQEGINRSVKVWISGNGNIAGTTNNGDPYLNTDATAFPQGSEAQSKADVRIEDINRDYLSSSLNISSQVSDNDGKFVPMGHKLSIHVWDAGPYNNNNNNNVKGYVVVADVKMLRGKTFGGQFINLMSSQQAERRDSPSKVRVLYYSPGYAGGSGISEKNTASFSFKKKIEENNAIRSPNENETFTFNLSKVGDPSFSQNRTNNGELVQFGELENGTYKLTEEYSKAGYGMSPSEIEVKVQNGNVIFNGQAYNSASPPEVINKKKPVLKIIKRDKDTHALLNGYQISLQKINSVGLPIGDKQLFGSMSDTDPGTTIIVPYADGIAFGKYILTEEKAPKSYSKETVDYGDGPEEKVYYLDVGQNGTVGLNESGNFLGNYKTLTKDSTGAYVLWIDNKKNEPPKPPEIKTELTLLKRDLKTQIPLAGASFTVYTNESATNVDTSVTGLEEETGDNGRLTLSNLVSGHTYYMKETKIPDSYNQTAGSVVYKIVVEENGRVIVTKGNSVVYQSDYDKVLKIDNEKGSANFKIWKYVTIDNEQHPREDAVFTLYTDERAQTPAQINGKNIEAVSGVDGIAIFKGLPLSSTYYMKETKAPENAVISNKIYRIVIDEAGQVTIYDGSTSNKVDDEHIEFNGTQKAKLKVENQLLQKISTKIFIKKADKTEVRNRVNQIRYGNVEGRDDTNIMLTSDFYPEYAINDLYGYQNAGITTNIKSLNATFEILKGDKTPFHPAKISSTNLTNKWGNTPVIRIDSGYETGNDYAEFELPDGDYWIREVTQPNGYSDSSKASDIHIKLSSKFGSLSFVNTDTGKPINQSDTVGKPDMDGIYEGYYIFGYNFPNNFSSLSDDDKQGIAINGTVNTLLITNAKGSNLTVEKKNEANNPLRGARFKLDDGEEHTGNIDDKSKFDFLGVTPGYHTLTEVHAPFGVSPLKDPVTFYKTDFGKIILPAKKFSEEEKNSVEEQSREIRNHYAEILKGLYENYIWVKNNLNDDDETRLAKENYDRKIIEMEDEIARLYEDDRENAKEVKNLITIAYEKDNDGKIKLDENGNVVKASILVKNMDIPITNFIIDSAPHILILCGVSIFTIFAYLRYLKYKKRKGIKSDMR
ncbi:MSCRAMM family protein [Clostridium perfringens]